MQNLDNKSFKIIGLLKSSDDLNTTLTNGIYEYYVEAGFPQNSPPKLSRGVVTIHQLGAHCHQTIYDFSFGNFSRYIQKNTDSNNYIGNWFSYNLIKI